MLKIKDCLFNKDEIKYIKPEYYERQHNPYVICVQFKDDDYFDIYFISQEERDEELNKILEKVSDNNVG